MIPIYCKLRSHCCNSGTYRCTATRICSLKLSTPKEIAIVFHNGSNYDYHFIIIEIPTEFKV